MALINFPSSPTLYQTFTVGSKTWVWNGSSWDLQGVSIAPAYNTANAAFIQANAAFSYANTISGGAAIDNVARTLANTAWTTANNALANTGSLITVNGTSVLSISNTTTTTSNTTGALIVAGGVGIGGDLYANNATLTGQVSLGGAAGSEAFRAVTTASGVNWLEGSGGATGSSNWPRLFANGSDSTIFLNLSAKGSSGVRFWTSATSASSGNEQFRVSATASAVNYVQVTGAATGAPSQPIISAQGSDANINIALQGKGTGAAVLLDSGGGGTLRAIPRATGGDTFLDVRRDIGGVSLLASSSVTNGSVNLISKGTGAIDLAAGSSGVNISNGNTVTAITRTGTGSGYTSIPSVAITAPTTAGGVQATATATMFISTVSIAGGGTGYTAGDTLTVSGGTFFSAATITVSTVSAGVITAVTVANGGSGYSVLPSNPVSVTGGTGTGATFNVTSWGLSTLFTITNAGSGYVEQPTVSFSGGGGSGAAAIAVVGSTPVIKTLTDTLSFNSAGGETVRIESSGGTQTGYLILKGSTAGTNGSYVSSALNALYLSAGAGSPIRFFTNGGGVSEQFRINHSASAVNYVQVTGAATGASPTISVQGSDTNNGLTFLNKGNAAFDFRNDPAATALGIEISQGTTVDRTTFIDLHSSVGSDFDFRLARNPTVNGNINYQNAGIGTHAFFTGTSNLQFTVAHTSNTVNYLQVTGSVTGASYANGPTISTQGTDTDIPLTITVKNNGVMRISSNATTITGVNGLGSVVTFNSVSTSPNYITLTNATSGQSPFIQTQGTDTNVNFVIDAKGTGQVRMYSGDYNGGAAYPQLFVGGVTSAVNYVQVVGGITGSSPTISTLGSDTNVSLSISAKGNSNVVLRNGIGINFIATNGGSSVANYLTAASNATGVAPALLATGSDTNIDLALTAKGTGNVLITGATANVSGNLIVGGTLTVMGNVTAVNYETILYTETANVLTANAISVTGNTISPITTSNSLYVGNRMGFANANNTSMVYQIYNQATNSLDVVFG